MGSHSVKYIRNYKRLKFVTRNVKFFCSRCKTVSNACSFLSISGELLGEMISNFGFAYSELLEIEFLLKNVRVINNIFSSIYF